ncbi:C-methyltransferase [Nitrospira tepida]|uniref:C-methyltransferase n=1 Tax=Nitrospira tepida TaxID=2973512 RepID=A0AA86N0R8_9BACT|nr:class I SAM-dependent methyltransferase [Nitrospira tepida]CAI4032577.1 C-methyltransferase [Nitrospira tepida]
MSRSKCRLCACDLEHTFVDLGMSPLANSYLQPAQLGHMERFYPLHVYVCQHCLLVQLEEFQSPEDIFGDYAYFSSYSDSFLQHARSYVDTAVERWGLAAKNLVVEVASNDGYLLQYFVERSVPVLGIEPAVNVAAVAMRKGIPTVTKFFGMESARQLAAEGRQGDLIIANNVLAHVPQVNDFVAGLKILLKPTGVVTVEFPHLAQLMARNQFDTIYHEHFSYFSFLVVERLFAQHGIKVFDVEEIWTHGGSLRVYGCHAEDDAKHVNVRVDELRSRERQTGFADLAHYLAFGPQVEETKQKLLSFLISAKREGKTVVGYGAPAKAITLLNYCGVRTDFIEYTVDRSPHKQGQYLPGVHVPIYAPERLRQTRPHYVLIFAWNLREEIMSQIAYIREWGGQFVVPIPEVAVYS